MKSAETEIQKNLAGRYRSLGRREFYLRYQDYWNSLLLENAPDNPEAPVLECGSGSGLLLSRLSRDYQRVFGLDLSSEMIKIARKTAPAAHLLAGHAQKMGLKNSVFDLVICKGSLHHLEEPAKALKEIHRILKPGGLLILSEPCRDNLLWRTLGRAATVLSSGFSGSHQVFESRELKMELKEAGFRVGYKRRFGLAGFALCAMAHHFPLMRFIPGNHLLSGLLIRLDEVLADRFPTRSLAWHIIIRAEKLGPQSLPAGT